MFEKITVSIRPEWLSEAVEVLKDNIESDGRIRKATAEAIASEMMSIIARRLTAQVGEACAQLIENHIYIDERKVEFPRNRLKKTKLAKGDLRNAAYADAVRHYTTPYGFKKEQAQQELG